MYGGTTYNMMWRLRKMPMSFWRRIALLWLAAAHLTVFVAAQATAPPPEVLHVTTQLVVLDATVLDKDGHIVTQALGRDDFLIEENKKPQAIYSFESAGEHMAAAANGDKEKSPESQRITGQRAPRFPPTVSST
jgi:hypothetical protein